MPLDKMPPDDAIATAERLERRAGEHPAEHLSLSEKALLAMLQEYRAMRLQLERAQRENRVYKLYLFTIPGGGGAAIAAPAAAQEPHQ